MGSCASQSQQDKVVSLGAVKRKTSEKIKRSEQIMSAENIKKIERKMSIESLEFQEKNKSTNSSVVPMAHRKISIDSSHSYEVRENIENGSLTNQIRMSLASRDNGNDNSHFTTNHNLSEHQEKTGGSSFTVNVVQCSPTKDASNMVDIETQTIRFRKRTKKDILKALQRKQKKDKEKKEKKERKEREKGEFLIHIFCSDSFNCY